MNVDLVFEGGGVLGIYYVGAYRALCENGFSVNRCAGTSAGSIISALVMAGYTPTELEEIINDTDFNQFNKKTLLSKIPVVGKPLSIIHNKGIYDVRIIETWVNSLLERKGRSKFKDVINDGKSDLKVIAADITRSKMLILPDDLTEYDTDINEFLIARAVAMSCAIPYYFTPLRLKSLDKVNCFVVDGGLLSSFPIWIFDIEGNLSQQTLGIKIKNLSSNTFRGKHDIISYTEDMINAPINEDESNFVRNKDLVRTIVIDYDGEVSGTDFSQVNKYKKEMIVRGYECTCRFLDEYNSNSSNIIKP